MTLAQLRHLIAMAESGSFSRSAEALFLTQPALSRSIRALEGELGQPLLDRIGRRSPRAVVAGADDLADSGRQMALGQAGSLRIGLGSGPGAMLMTPLLMRAATRHPRLHVDISRGRTELLVQSLRERSLDALVVDARSLAPAPDLHTSDTHEMRGAFLCRRGHPLARKRGGVSFEQVRAYPIASTPLSDELARMLVERFGPQAHPLQCVTLRCEEVPSLVELTRHSDTVLLAIRAAGPDLVELALKPAMTATARFCLVTLAGRSEAPSLSLVRELMQELLRDPRQPSRACRQCRRRQRPRSFALTPAMPQGIHTRTFSFGAPTASTKACVTFSITAFFCSAVRPSIM
jgi:DNA-binding transcriptional LysR family regulator